MLSSMFIVFVPIDRFIFGSKLLNQPAFFTEKNQRFKITPHLSTLSSNSNHSLNLYINVSIDQCWIFFPTINVNLSFVKAKQMENVMPKKLFCTECSRILSQPLKKKRVKECKEKQYVLDRFIFGSKLLNQPAYFTEENKSFEITPYLSTLIFKFKPFAQSIYQCVN